MKRYNKGKDIAVKILNVRNPFNDTRENFIYNIFILYYMYHAIKNDYFKKNFFLFLASEEMSYTYPLHNYSLIFSY